MNRKTIAILLSFTVVLPALAVADELTQIIQQDLVTLGYDPGNTDGEATTETIIAISKFQAEHDLEVTGEATPQLAGVIKAAISQRNAPAAPVAGTPIPASAAAAATPAPAAQDPAALEAARQACLQDRIARAQETNQKKRGFGSLMRAVSRTASRVGGDTGYDIARTTHDIYNVNATAADLESAAQDLGLTQSDIEECRYPPM